MTKTTENIRSIDYAIDCIQNNKYDKILIDVHKFIDTKLDNSIKNIYDKYSLSSYHDLATLKEYTHKFEEMKSNDEMKNAMIGFIQNDNNDDTIKSLENIIEESSEENRVAILFLAISYARSNKLEKAIEILENSNNKDDTHIFIYGGIMKNNINLNSPNKYQIDDHLSTGKSFYDKLNNSILLRLFQKYNDALESLNAIDEGERTQLNQDQLYLFFTTLGIVHFQRKCGEKAIEAFDKAINILDVNHFEAKRSRAICLAISNDPANEAEAINIFEKLSQDQENKFDNDIHRNLAVSRANKYPTLKHLDHNNHDYNKIIECFNLTIENNPFHSPSYFDLGTFFYKQNEFKKAQKEFEKAIEYANYKLKYYRQYVESFLKNNQNLHDDLSTLNGKLDEGLNQKHTQYTITDYLYLLKIKSQCLIHTHLDSKKNDGIEIKLQYFIKSIDEIFIKYENKLSKEIKNKIHETNSLLYNYIEDVQTINARDKHILKAEDLTKVKLSTSDKSLFRGMNRTSWDLKPNIFRGDSKDPKSTMLENFKREAIGVSNDNYDHYQTIDWFGLMQHHGALTALLDWTQSFSIGLFFAMHLDNPQDRNQYGIPCIYILEYANILKINDVEGIIEVDYSHNSNATNNDTTSNAIQYNDDDILLFAPRISHKRADIQKSMFTYHRSDVNINQSLSNKTHYILKKYIISPLLIDLFTKILEKDHINIATVYPDLQNLSKRLRNMGNINNLEFSNN